MPCYGTGALVILIGIDGQPYIGAAFSGFNLQNADLEIIEVV